MSNDARLAHHLYSPRAHLVASTLFLYTVFSAHYVNVQIAILVAASLSLLI